MFATIQSPTLRYETDSIYSVLSIKLIRFNLLSVRSFDNPTATYWRIGARIRFLPWQMGAVAQDWRIGAGANGVKKEQDWKIGENGPILVDWNSIQRCQIWRRKRVRLGVRIFEKCF